MDGDRPVYSVKRGDTAPPLRATLIQGTRKVIDLTGATVRFKMKCATGDATPAVDAAATVAAATKGKVEYAWQTADTATAGLFRAEFEVTFEDGSVQTVPSDGYIYVEVVGDLG